ncbi:MAG TPA: YdeI/OmpD-associated family protein [Pyrinomonadaceae bacterium]|nr:YdeI/OmpD-associated family protein [Pyrinomonadaceae bacterium]
MKPKFFSSPEQFRQWLEQSHDSAEELLVGFHKKDSGKKSVTYAQALDEALCYGWIDGVRKSLDETRYTIRFTPRKPKSIWSNVNVRHVERLQKEGRMAEPGLRAYARRDPKRTGIYAFENEAREFSPEFEKRFRANKAAWQFFQTEPPSIRRTCIFWVMSAKKEETRVRRLDQLITRAAQGIRSGVMETKSRTDQKK